jgi:hypothetical protein
MLLGEYDEDFEQKMDNAQQEWDQIPEDIRDRFDALFASAVEKGHELLEHEREWRRVGIALAMLDDEDEKGDLSSFTKTGLKAFPQFSSELNWEEYVSDFNELVETNRPAGLRIRLLRQAIGSDSKRRLDAYLMPASLYTDFDEYVTKAANILGPAGGDWQVRRQAARCIQRNGEKGRAWLERYRKMEALAIRGTSMKERFKRFMAVHPEVR